MHTPSSEAVLLVVEQPVLVLRAEEQPTSSSRSVQALLKLEHRLVLAPPVAGVSVRSGEMRLVTMTSVMTDDRSTEPHRHSPC